MFLTTLSNNSSSMRIWWWRWVQLRKNWASDLVNEWILIWIVPKNKPTTVLQLLKKLSQCFTVPWCLVYNTILSNGITSRKMYLIVYHIRFQIASSLLNLDNTIWYNKSNNIITHSNSFWPAMHFSKILSVANQITLILIMETINKIMWLC